MRWENFSYRVSRVKDALADTGLEVGLTAASFLGLSHSLHNFLPAQLVPAASIAGGAVVGKAVDKIRHIKQEDYQSEVLKDSIIYLSVLNAPIFEAIINTPAPSHIKLVLMTMMAGFNATALYLSADSQYE